MRRPEWLWHGDSAASTAARIALAPLAAAWGAVAVTRSRLYDAGVLRTEPSAIPCVSVGNLTVGGTGKTPFAAWLASRLGQRVRPAIVLRGYGGDEAEVHRRLNPGIPVITNADRGDGVRAAAERAAQVVVLDDAFQHRRIARVADVVLVSAEQFRRPRWLMPAGPWREPLGAAARADLIVVTRKAATPQEAREVARALRARFPTVPITVVALRPAALEIATGSGTRPLDTLRGADVVALAGVGEPEAFFEQLRQLGARVTGAGFRDHHAFSDGDVRALAARVPPGGFALCTLKDAVKLASRWPGPSTLWYVSQQLVAEDGMEHLDRLVARLIERAAATSTATAG